MHCTRPRQFQQSIAQYKFQQSGCCRKLINISDTSGNQLLSFFPVQNTSSLVFCSSNLVLGSSYNIHIGGSHNGSSIDGIFSGGTYSAGTLYASVTQTYTTTEVGSRIAGPGFGTGGGNFGNPHTPPPGM
jgi:hypothetical protein